MAPKWLTKPTKPTKITTTKQTTTTVKPFDDYDIVSNCSDFAFDGFRYIIVWALPARVGSIGLVCAWPGWVWPDWA